MTVRRAFIFLVVIVAASLRGQIPADVSDNKGTDFIIAFPQNVAMPATTMHRLTLFVAAEEATRIEISGPEVATQEFDITASAVLELAYASSSPQVSLMNQVGNEGIRVRSVDPVDPTLEGAPIVVYAMNRRPGSAGAYMALPVDVLGTKYRAVARPGISPTATGSQVTIVSTQDNTRVTITTPVDVPDTRWDQGEPGVIVLNQLQSFLLQLNDGDLTGTLVTADKPIAVFAGNQNGNVGGGSSDHIVEQMVPVTAWGDEFVIAPIAPRTAGDLVRVVAHEDETDVELNGVVVTTLGAGKFHEFTQPSSSGTWVRTSKPSLVTQYNKGQGQPGDATLTDPFAMLVPPIAQFSRLYLFKTPATFSSRIGIVVKQGDEAGLLLDKAALPADTTWTAVNGYLYARVTVANGAHRLEHQEPTVQFGAWVYGHAFSEGYGHTAGQLVADHISPVVSSVPADITLEATGPRGATVTWTNPSATDFGRGGLPVSCTPASGSVFGLGMHVVDCGATDPAGNSTTDNFSVTIKDTTPPILQLPPDVVMRPTGPEGAVVSYDVRATDLVDPDVDVVCSPASGSVFPAGPGGTTFTTSVNCTATDASGNFTTATFSVTVPNSAPMCSAAVPSIALISRATGNMVPIAINGVTDPDGDSVTIKIATIFQDERTGRTIDGFGIGIRHAWIRAERDARGNGRVYHVGFTATDRVGLSCSGEVKVAVPRHRRQAAIDEGALFDSTVRIMPPPRPRGRNDDDDSDDDGDDDSEDDD